jgi:DNA processing protein
VIGTPLTRCYPSENAELQRRIGQVGAVVSQFAPSSKTRPSCFPMRNATMSGLTLGTVVIGVFPQVLTPRIPGK